MSPREDDITAWFRQQSHLDPEAFPIGIGDDMAEIRVAGDATILITTDMLLDGTHFDLATATLQQVGYKSMAASLSDCAAMATIPLAAVVAVGLPAGFGPTQLKELHAGIARAADKYRCPLVGGDITSWKEGGRFVVNVAMLSRRAGHPPIRRNGARAGDVICVTGALGGSGWGRHLEFEPRVDEALKIAGLVTVHAMMDISDGLTTDLNRICTQSGVGAILDATAIPLSDEAKRRPDPLDSALNEGEDFELLFTLAPSQWESLSGQWHRSVPVTQVGCITQGRGMQMRTADGRRIELVPGGYDHLSP
jgi:thiamine-monophosphate kinase